MFTFALESIYHYVRFFLLRSWFVLHLIFGEVCHGLEGLCRGRGVLFEARCGRVLPVHLGGHLQVLREDHWLLDVVIT